MKHTGTPNETSRGGATDRTGGTLIRRFRVVEFDCCDVRRPSYSLLVICTHVRCPGTLLYIRFMLQLCTVVLCRLELFVLC